MSSSARSEGAVFASAIMRTPQTMFVFNFLNLALSSTGGGTVTLPHVGIVARFLTSGAPDSYVKRALPAMTDMGFLEANHQRTHFRHAQPLRNLAAQNTAF